MKIWSFGHQQIQISYFRSWEIAIQMFNVDKDRQTEKEEEEKELGILVVGLAKLLILGQDLLEKTLRL